MATTVRAPFWISLLLLGFVASPAASEILLDGAPVETSRAIFLPDHSVSKGFYMMPKEPRLARDADGNLRFLFLQYVGARDKATGAIMHFLVDYGLTDAERQAAEQQLQNRVPGAKVLGDVVFTDGTFNVISASAQMGSETRTIHGESRRAPLLPGHQAAVAMALEGKASTLLKKSFEKKTSDVSVQFMLTYEGLSPAYRAILHIDWDKVYKHRSTRASLGVPLVARATIEKSFESLVESGAVTLDVVGDDAEMDELLQTAYGTLLSMMFEATPRPANQKPDKPGKFSKFLGLMHNVGNYGYKMREVRREGKYSVDLTRRKRGTRQVVMAGNISGDLRSHKDDKRYFDVVDIADPDLEKRTIDVVIDGDLGDLYADYVNFVGVRLSRVRDDGTVATAEGKLFRQDFAEFEQEGGRISLPYLRLGDAAPGWLDYELTPVWSFRGGVEVLGKPIRTSQSAVTLSPPFGFHSVQVTANEDNLLEHDLTGVEAHFRHEYAGVEREKGILILEDQPLTAQYRYVGEQVDPSYEVRLIFHHDDGKRTTTEWRRESTLFLNAIYDPDDAEPSP